MKERRIEALPAAYKKRAIRYAEELIRCDSSNPPGDEYAAAAFAAGELEQNGFEVRLDEFEPKRCNVTATLGGCQETGLIFLGHLDVVPANGDWVHEKFVPQTEGDRLYGRGACDMKGGIAAMLAAAAALAHSGAGLQKGLTILLDSDEEHSNKGINRILAQGPLKAQAAIVGEPSGLGLLLGNKGYSSFYIRTKGVSCHASQPEKGENAIYKMAGAVRLLEEYAQKLAGKTNPYLGSASLSVGTIRGGTRVNIVPDECVCEVERRILPGETCEMVQKELEQLLKGIGEVLPRGTFTPTSLLEEEHPFTAETARIMKNVLKKEPEIGVFSGGTEAAYISQYGIPTLIVGPGSLKQAHRVDEYVSITQVEQCADIYFQLMQSVCGGLSK